jgi:predicted nucleotidyltransferase
VAQDAILRIRQNWAVAQDNILRHIFGGVTVPEIVESKIGDLPAPVDRVLNEFLEAARKAFGDDLRSVVLYGSAAEGKLRATSDVNVILILSAFDPAKADRLRAPLGIAQAAIRLDAMFLLQAEIGAAVEAFAQKFSDVLRRRRVLYGDDPFAQVSVPRSAAIVRLKQALLNLILRLRAFYIARSLREEQLALVVADTAGPLRSCAATLLELEGQPAGSPKDALQRVASSFPDNGWDAALSCLSEAREKRVLPPGVAGPTLFRLIELAARMRARAQLLS